MATVTLKVLHEMVNGYTWQSYPFTYPAENVPVVVTMGGTPTTYYTNANGDITFNSTGAWTAGATHYNQVAYNNTSFSSVDGNTQTKTCTRKKWEQWGFIKYNGTPVFYEDEYSLYYDMQGVPNPGDGSGAGVPEMSDGQYHLNGGTGWVYAYGATTKVVNVDTYGNRPAFNDSKTITIPSQLAYEDSYNFTGHGCVIGYVHDGSTPIISGCAITSNDGSGSTLYTHGIWDPIEQIYKDHPGKFFYTFAGDDSYTLTFTKSGYAPAKKYIISTYGGYTNLGTIYLDHYGHVCGLVDNNGTFLANVAVTSNDGTGRTFYTDANGWYDYPFTSTGTYSMTFTKAGYVPRTITGIVVSALNSSQQADRNLYLYSHATGTVKNSVTNAAIQGVSVTSTDSYQNPATATTNASGVYTTNNKQGTWTFTYTKTGYVTKTWSLTLGSEQTITKNVLLVPQN
jgi:hypothetical protein